MKKIVISIILVIACIFSLTACRNTDNKNQNTDGVGQTTSAPTPTPTGININDETTYPVGSEFYTLRHSKDNWTFSYV